MPAAMSSTIGFPLDLNEEAESKRAQGGLNPGLPSDARQHFLAALSHAIRTPMNGVVGMTELLNDTKLDSPQRDFLQTIKVSADRVLELIDGVLDWSRAETGRLLFADRPFDLRGTLRMVMGRFEPRFRAAGLWLHLELDASLPRHVRGDENRFRFMVQALLENALFLTDRGGATLSAQSRDQGRLFIEVRDTGRGVSREDFHRVFANPDEVDAEWRQRFGDGGVGLSLCRVVADAMGGRVGFTTRETQGSVFWLELPFPFIDAPAASDLMSLPAEAAARWRNKSTATVPRILLVEDNTCSRVIARRMLQKLHADIEIDQASDGLEAVEACKNNVYDLILMDCEMPNLNGLDATRKIRALQREQHCYSPIVAMTAEVTPLDRKRCLDAGMDDYLTKPVRRKQLLDTAQRWIWLET